MATEQTPEIWAGVATQYVGAWGQAAPIVQIAAIVAAVVIVAIIAWAWTRKKSGGGEPSSPGIPVDAFAHVVEEQARQTEALRCAVESLSDIVHETRKLLEARTFCPFPARSADSIMNGASGPVPKCGASVDA